MSAIVSTSGRLHSDFMCLLFLREVSYSNKHHVLRNRRVTPPCLFFFGGMLVNLFFISKHTPPCLFFFDEMLVILFFYFKRTKGHGFLSMEFKSFYNVNTHTQMKTVQYDLSRVGTTERKLLHTNNFLFLVLKTGCSPT